MNPPSRFRLDRPAEGILAIRVSGSWSLATGIPSLSTLETELDQTKPAIRNVVFDSGDLGTWDSALVTFVVGVMSRCADLGIEVEPGGLPAGVQRLVAMARAAPDRPGARRTAKPTSFIHRLGEITLSIWQDAENQLEFLGEAILSFSRFLRGKARFRKDDFVEILQNVGVEALFIVLLINFLVGAILAFVGAIQLQQFGAQIFVANLVVVAVTREMASMMTGIVLSGRTGAAFAANLGTMTVNEEIDAIRTMGLNPMDYLVLPRMMALALMTPLLCVYANVMGILGGMVVGVVMLDISALAYVTQSYHAFQLDGFFAGLIKGSVYGVLIALAGCLRGIQCGRSASAVGDAATSAAVTGIVFVILADMIITVIYSAIGF